MSPTNEAIRDYLGCGMDKARGVMRILRDEGFINPHINGHKNTFNADYKEPFI